MKPEFMYNHLLKVIKNSLVKYGGMRVVRIPVDLGGSSQVSGCSQQVAR